MGLNINQKPLTEEEMAAMAAEARKSTAEGEFVILSEGKKKLTADSEALKGEIESNKKILEETKIEVLKIKNNILDLQTEQIKENKKLSDVLSKVKEAEDILLLTEEKASKVKEEIKSEKLQAELYFDSLKKQSEKDLQEIKEIKEGILSEINVLKINLSNQVNQNEIESAKNKTLVIERENISTEINTLKGGIEKLKNDILDLTTTVKKKELELSSLSDSIKTKTIEDKKLDADITKKKEEYKDIENRAFVMLKRGEEINQKELFIRSQFERAGVKWQEE